MSEIDGYKTATVSLPGRKTTLIATEWKRYRPHLYLSWKHSTGKVNGFLTRVFNCGILQDNIPKAIATKQHHNYSKRANSSPAPKHHIRSVRAVILLCRNFQSKSFQETLPTAFSISTRHHRVHGFGMETGTLCYFEIMKRVNLEGFGMINRNLLS